MNIVSSVLGDIERYQSKGRKINRSNEHKDLWIFETPDGKWFSISNSQSGILRSNPPDPHTEVVTEYGRISAEEVNQLLVGG